MKKNWKTILSCTLAAIMLFESPAAPGLFKSFQTTSAAETAQHTVYKVMPLGDSITAGWCAGSSEHQFGGYRIYLADALERNGYSDQIDFVGKWNTGEGYDMDNNGTNGATIAKDYSWANSIQTDVNNGILETYQPDVVMLQIGTNDINNQSSKDSQLDILTINERLETLVDSIFEHMKPDRAVFLASIPYMKGKSSVHNTDVDTYNAFIQSLVTKKSAEGKHIFFVDINKTIADDQFDDDLHPNQAGYQSMGLLWYDVLEAFLKHPENYVTLPEETAPSVSSSPAAEETAPATSSAPATEVTPSVSPAPLASPTPVSDTPSELAPPAANTTIPATEPAANPFPTHGTRVKKKGFTYKIHVNAAGTSAQVSCVKVSSKKRSAGRLSFPDSVTIGTHSYPLTSLGKNLLKNSKVKQVVLGKNITSISAGAFENCKNLRKVTMKGNTLKSISRTAGKNTSGVTFHVPSVSKKKYKTLLAKGGFANLRVVAD